jgi:hypothetical protein
MFGPRDNVHSQYYLKRKVISLLLKMLFLENRGQRAYTIVRVTTEINAWIQQSLSQSGNCPPLTELEGSLGCPQGPPAGI